MTSSTDPRDGSRSFHLLVNIFHVDESLSNEYNLAACSGATAMVASNERQPRVVGTPQDQFRVADRRLHVQPIRARGIEGLPGPVARAITRIRRCLLLILAGSLARRSGHLTARTVQIPKLIVQAGRSGWP